MGHISRAAKLADTGLISRQQKAMGIEQRVMSQFSPRESKIVEELEEKKPERKTLTHWIEGIQFATNINKTKQDLQFINESVNAIRDDMDGYSIDLRLHALSFKLILLRPPTQRTERSCSSTPTSCPTLPSTTPSSAVLLSGSTAVATTARTSVLSSDVL
ncbi:hypothetical protein JCM10295v2_005767 [Rhodotorula toruloides]